MADRDEAIGSSFIPALFKPAALLPVAQHRDRLLYLVETFPVTIVVGHTGSGKTTQIPQFLLQAGWCNDGKQIAVTQVGQSVKKSKLSKFRSLTIPCKAATRRCHDCRDSSGRRNAMQNWPGSMHAITDAICAPLLTRTQVGYSIRFEDVTSAATKIKFLTDGLLLREALVDPLLSRYSVIMVDEAHERSLSTDILLGLLKKIRKKRPELRIIVSSATLDAKTFLQYFLRDMSAPPQEPDNEPEQGGDVGRIISFQGRAYPVDIHYLELPAENYVEKAVETVFQIHETEDEGDILVFLTGREEIENAIQMIADQALSLDPKAPRLQPLPLYAGLTTEEQAYVFEPAAENTRKVIVSTNIAEASVTIDGIKFVVDCGFVKLRAYNPITGIELLTATPVSKASATQRAGRAGRTKPGKCYRLYTQQAFEALEDSTTPEIQRSNLAPVVLQLKALGIDNIVRFDFLTPPPSQLVLRALELLFSLGALDDYSKLTRPLGLRMAELAVEPMLGKVLLESTKFGCLSEMLSISAMTSLQASPWFTHDGERTAQETARRKFAAEEGDHITLLNVYHAFVTTGRKDAQWCRDNYLNFKAMSRAVSIRNQLRRYLERFGINVTESLSDPDVIRAGGPDKAEQIRRCLTTGYFSHAAKMQPDGSFRTVDEQTVLYAHPSSLLFVSLTIIVVSAGRGLLTFDLVQHRKADWVIFHEIVEHGGKTQIRDITKIERDWLVEYAPEYYQVQQR
jgi:ATP-dependent RNA helicase DDX35